LEVKEVTWDSVYLDFLSKQGRVEAQIVITGPGQAEATVAIASRYGPDRQLQTVLQASEDHKKALAHILNRLPSVRKVLPSNDSTQDSTPSKNQRSEEYKEPRENKQNEGWDDHRTVDQVADEIVFIPSSLKAFEMDQCECTVIHKTKDTVYFSALRESDGGAVMDDISFIDERDRHVISYKSLALSEAAVLRAKNKDGIESIRKSLFDKLKEGDRAVVDFYIRKTSSTTSIEAARVLEPEDERAESGNPFIEKSALLETDETGKTVLHRAVIGGNERGTEVLVAAGADINASDNDGYTPLHYAAGKGHSAIADLLIRCGADIAAQDNSFGTTPLHYAAMFGRTDLCKILFEAGSSAHLLDNDGASPYMYARNRGHEGTAQFLKTIEEENQHQDAQQ